MLQNTQPFHLKQKWHYILLLRPFSFQISWSNNMSVHPAPQAVVVFQWTAFALKNCRSHITYTFCSRFTSSPVWPVASFCGMGIHLWTFADLLAKRIPPRCRLVKSIQQDAGHRGHSIALLLQPQLSLMFQTFRRVVSLASPYAATAALSTACSAIQLWSNSASTHPASPGFVSPTKAQFFVCISDTNAPLLSWDSQNIRSSAARHSLLMNALFQIFETVFNIATVTISCFSIILYPILSYTAIRLTLGH